MQQEGTIEIGLGKRRKIGDKKKTHGEKGIVIWTLEN
jgi:hypothetical protein